MASIVYLALGSNLGNRTQLLNEAVHEINESIGKIISLSTFLETPPWGFSSPHPFLNAVLCVETTFSPTQLLATTQLIEKQLGRTSKTNSRYHDRTIDIDILFYDDIVIQTPTLTIPHPLLHLRDFVLLPLHEIAPDLTHPKLKKTIFTLLEDNKRSF